MKARCRECWYLDRGWPDWEVVGTDHHFCGAHGCTSIDPDGEQRWLRWESAPEPCSFEPKDKQLSLF